MLFSFFCLFTLLFQYSYSSKCTNLDTTATYDLVTIGDYCADSHFAWPTLDNSVNYTAPLKLFQKGDDVNNFANTIMLVPTTLYYDIEMDNLVGSIPYQFEFPVNGEGVATYSRCWFIPEKPVLFYDGEPDIINSVIQNLKDGQNISCTLESDPNNFLPWYRVFRYIHWIVDLPWNIMNLVLAIYTYYQLKSQKKLQLLPQVALSFEVFISMIRFIYALFYAYMSYSIFFSPYNQIVGNILLTFSIPWSLINSFLVAIAWNAIYRSIEKLSHHVDLSQYKRLFIIVSVLIVIIGYLGDAQRTFYKSMPEGTFLHDNFMLGATITSVIYGIFTLIIAVYFLYSGRLILNLLLEQTKTSDSIQANTSSDRLKSTISVMTSWLRITGGLLILQALSSFSIGIKSVFYTPAGLNLIFCGVYMSQYAISTTRIFAFRSFTSASSGSTRDSTSDSNKYHSKRPSQQMRVDMTTVQTEKSSEKSSQELL